MTLRRGGFRRLLPAACLVWAWSGMVAAAAGLPDFSELVVRNGPAVVNISTEQRADTEQAALPKLPFELPEGPDTAPLNEFFRRFFGDQAEPPMPDASLGSGFIITADGYVLTNHHVVDGADTIIVRLSDRSELSARLVGSDARSDIALLKVESKNGALPTVKIGDPQRLKVGEWVLAIGSPFGFDHSATAGIVSAKGRSLPSENYVPFIQTDVAINPGNSGGPLFNQDGEVVGMNSQIYSRTGGYMGLSFAIPIEVATDVADQLKTTGHVSRGWLGVLIQDINKGLAESFGMSQPHGALVAKVLPDSPAKAAGIRVGDVIVSFNGKEIQESAALPPIVGSSKVGKEIPVGIIRNRKQIEIDVKLGELPEEGPAATARAKTSVERTSRLGLSVTDLSDEQKQELEIEEGVLVQQVVEGAAARAGISKGDVILSINNQPVRSARQFDKLVNALPAGKSIIARLSPSGLCSFIRAAVAPASALFLIKFANNISK